MPAKKIAIIDGYELRFDGRARGQETPYYDGVIFKDGKEVGRFNNGGTGGPTTIFPHTLSDAFGAMVVAEMKRQGYDRAKGFIEPEGLVVEFAEIRGYKKSLAGIKTEELWQMYIAEEVKFWKAHDAKYGKKLAIRFTESPKSKG